MFEKVRGLVLLPRAVGASNVAWPRLNRFAWHLSVAAAVFLLAAIAVTGMGSGWTLYDPYADRPEGDAAGGVVPAVAGVFLLGTSAGLTGLNFIVTMHRPPASAIPWRRMPPFASALYATAAVELLAVPVLAVALVLAVADRVLHVGVFDPAVGGDPIRFARFFWFYRHPTVYVLILPAFGVVDEVVAVHTGLFTASGQEGDAGPQRGRSRIPQLFRKLLEAVYPLLAFLTTVGIALLGLLAWGGQAMLSGRAATLNMLLLALPAAVGWLVALAGVFLFSALRGERAGGNPRSATSPE